MAIGGGGFNPYSAGNKSYGAGRPFPTNGKVDPLGYKERDAKASAQRNAMLRFLKAGAAGRFFSPEWLIRSK